MDACCEIDLAPMEAILDAAGVEQPDGPRSYRPDDLIPLLQQVQKTYNFLPVPALRELSQRTGIPASQVYGVITFYSQFYLEPRGKHVVRCCKGTACHVRGGNKVIEAVEDSLGIGENQTTEDMKFSFETVACLGACALAPVTVIDEKYYGKMTARQTEKILSGLAAEED